MGHKSVLLAGLAAGLMLAASPAAMAAKISLTGGTFGTPVVTGPSVANEQFGTSVLGDAAGGAVTRQHVEIFPSAANAFSNAQMVVTFNLTNAKLKDPLGTTSLVGAGCAPVINISSGGAAGSTSVVFLVDTAQACTKLQLQLGALDSVTGDVTVSATLKSAGGLDVDNGIQNGPVTYAKQVNGIDGTTATATTAAIDVSGSAAKKLTAGTDVGTAQLKFASGAMSLVVPANTATLANATFGNAFVLPAAATSTVTIAGLPAAASGVLLTSAGAARANIDTAVEIDAATTIHAGSVCTAPAGGTSTCSLNAAATAAWAALGANGAAAIVSFNGTTVIDSSTITASATLSPNTTGYVTTDTLFTSKTIGSIGSGACVAEFASVIGANSGGFVSTLRMANASGIAAKVFAAATSDAGTHSGAIQLTQANTGATQGLDASNLLPAGGTIEVTGEQLETLTGVSFSAWGGNTSRGRVRLMLEAKADGNGGTTSAAPNACKSEGFVCFGTSCTLMQQTGDGRDGVTIGAQKN